MDEFMKTIKVVAEVIKRNNKIFVTQRGYGEFKDGWEFPGGKVEKGETKEEALIREIKEEMDTVIKVDSYLDTIEYYYQDFHLSMDCFVCSIVEGHLVLKEHEDSKWIKKEEIDTLNWLPADLVIIDKVKEMMG